ncbi:molybdate ABC transporter ATP-binding protein ModF [Treponema sp.]
MISTMGAELIRFRECSIGKPLKPALQSISWELHAGECWLICGGNGSGKSALAAALAGKMELTFDAEAAAGGDHFNTLAGRAALVSFEEAAALIEKERYEDDSDFVEGGVDEGRTARAYIASALSDEQQKLFPAGRGLEQHPAVLSCGIGPFLDRGLKRLSTGEIRRTLLCRALASEPSLLILDEPFEGLDAASRKGLAAILEKLAHDTVAGKAVDCREDSLGKGSPYGVGSPILVLLAQRWQHIPEELNRVVELAEGAITFQGKRSEYEALLRVREAEQRATGASGETAQAQEDLRLTLQSAEEQAAAFKELCGETDLPLVEMNNVVVEYSGTRVLDGIGWIVRRGEHWLLRGPNGSGKTTLLELITGDNPQVFRNDIKLFGKRRGTGETIWELKKRMGVVSHRLHLEYRYLNDASLTEVLVSGLKDSIGIYERLSDAELALAQTWLSLAHFEDRGTERFGSLSYGEQRALLVARAAMKESELLILDEPCHGLDEEHRSRVLALIQAIAEHGVSTLIHVTHDPSEVLPCAKRVLELRPGSEPAWAVLKR